MMLGLWVAAVVVTFMQYLRARRRNLLPLLALFGFLALAESREPWSLWRKLFQAGAAAAGLVLVAVLSSPREERKGSP